jgi:hypothetical protein
MKKPAVFCIGCSWTQHWPRYLLKYEAQWEWRDGGSLYTLAGVMRKTDLTPYEAIVVQLPTPIRTHMPDQAGKKTTVEIFVDFLKRYEGPGIGPAKKQILKWYCRRMGEIGAMHDHVAFFCYNTAGYPFQCPLDFGPDAETIVATAARSNGYGFVSLDLSGEPGWCKHESKTEPARKRPRGWNLVHPEHRNITVIDAHPNDRANRLAARVVEDYLDENL